MFERYLHNGNNRRLSLTHFFKKVTRCRVENITSQTRECGYIYILDYAIPRTTSFRVSLKELASHGKVQTGTRNTRDESDEYLDPATGGAQNGKCADTFPEVRITQQGKPRNYISTRIYLCRRPVSPVPVLCHSTSSLVRPGDHFVVSLLNTLTHFSHIQKVTVPTPFSRPWDGINKAVTIAEILNAKCLCIS
jgi:hypothetical protein